MGEIEEVSVETLNEFFGPLATVFPTTATVEADFSAIRIEKDDYRDSLTDFSLEGCSHAKQFQEVMFFLLLVSDVVIFVIFFRGFCLLSGFCQFVVSHKKSQYQWLIENLGMNRPGVNHPGRNCLGRFSPTFSVRLRSVQH